MTPPASLEPIVGADCYRVWLSMLTELVPRGRTHRLSTVVASMLRYAWGIVSAKPDSFRDDAVAQALLEGHGFDEDDAPVKPLLDVVIRLFEDAGVDYRRTSRKGEEYSIAENALDEFEEWYQLQ